MKDFVAVRDTYTFITEGKDENGPTFRVWLKSGDQTFSIGTLAWDTREEAEWYREQLSHALLQIVNEQRDRPSEAAELINKTEAAIKKLRQ